MKKIVLLTATSLIFSSCASIFLPRRQKITIKTGQAESIVYLNKEEFGRGSVVVGKVVKDGPKEILVKRPGYKDQHCAIVQDHRPVAYWLLQIPNPIWMVYVGFFLDGASQKNVSFPKVNDFTQGQKLVFRGNSDKYLNISSIKMDIKNTDRDVNFFSVPYSEHLEEDINTAEKRRQDVQLRVDTKAKKKKKTGAPSQDDKRIMSENTKFTESIYNTLRSTGFVDTVNRVFSDNNNTLVLEAKIKKVNIYTITGKKWPNMRRAKLFLTWYVKNTYDEVLDSIETSDFSGDFVERYDDNEQEVKVLGDAVDVAYLNLHKRKEFTRFLKQENVFDISEPLLKIPGPKGVVGDKADAALASVIVKTANGHGSGFAITNDGYLVTNYHIVAGRLNNKPSAVTIITSDGEELSADIVRCNKFRDLVLLKVNRSFEKAFRCSANKAFKNMQTVFTVGAPKSIELGQSISTGVISNERKNNNNNLLQLGMSVNAGNSGGPVFDENGNLHGVIVSKLVGQNTEGVSFAIPSYLLMDYLKISLK